MASMSRGRVVLLVLDGLGPEFVSSERTPNLIAVAHRGGIAPAGGVSDLLASTHPAHATLLTGELGPVHGVMASRVFAADGEVVARPQVKAPTLLARARATGASTAVLSSDPNVLTTIRGDEADLCWPALVEVSAKADPATGYIADAETLQRAIAAVETGFDLIVIQLQAIDTALHRHGIDDERTRAEHRAADVAVETLLQALQSDWRRTLFIIVSDHRAENVIDPEPVRLAEALHGCAMVIEDGSAALMRFSPEALATALAAARACSGVEAVIPVDAEQAIVWATPGRAFGRQEITYRAVHGNGTTRPGVAIVAGGHANVPGVANHVRQSVPHLSTWASLALEVLVN